MKTGKASCTTGTLSVLGLCSLALAGSAFAGSVLEDAVFKLDLRGDANGNGFIDAGEVGNAYDFSAAEPATGFFGDADGAKSYGPAYGTLPDQETADVQNPFYAYTTNSATVLRFHQDHGVVGGEDRTTRTGVVFPGAAATGDVVTVYARFRWDGTCPAAVNKTPYYFLQNGNKNGWSDFGFSLSVDGVSVDGATGRTNACIGYKLSNNSKRLPTLAFKPGNWVDLFATASNSAAGKCDLGFTICKAVADGANFKPPVLLETNFTVDVGMSYPAGENSTNLVLGTYHESYVNANISRCFKGAIADLMLWKRALSKEEKIEVMAGRHGAKWIVGVVNGSADEFNAGSNDNAPVADTYFPESMPWRMMRKRLTAGSPTLVLKSPLAARDQGRPMVFSLTPVLPDGADGRVRLAVNGNVVGSFDTASRTRRNMAIPAAMWKRDGDGNVTVSVTRMGASGEFMIDAVSLSGSWQVSDDDYFDDGGMLNETYAPGHFFAGDGDASHAGNSFSVGKRHTSYAFGVWIPYGNAGLGGWRFSTRALSMYASPAETREYELAVNGAVVTNKVGSFEPLERFDAALPPGTLADGMNFVEFRQTKPASGTDWIFFDFWGMSLVPAKKQPGMLIVR